jgi:hypothetical protein
MPGRGGVEFAFPLKARETAHRARLRRRYMAMTRGGLHEDESQYDDAKKGFDVVKDA